MEVDARSSGCTECYQKFTEGFPAMQKVDRGSQKVYRLQCKCTEVDKKSPVRTESGQKLTEGFPAAQKEDGSSRKVYRPQGKLTEVDGSTPATWTVDGS